MSWNDPNRISKGGRVMDNLLRRYFLQQQAANFRNLLGVETDGPYVEPAPQPEPPPPAHAGSGTQEPPKTGSPTMDDLIRQMAFYNAIPTYKTRR